MQPTTWTVRARNLAEHARNPIHTDAGAQAAGFPRALVPGVTTYAYLTHPAVAAWGLDWLQHGGGEVRFRSPVFEHDELRCTPSPLDDGDGYAIDALVGADPAPRATFTVWRDAGPPPPLRAGEVLRTRHIRLEGEWGLDYGLRVGDDLPIYADRGIIHPAVWPALANHLVHADVARGSWIHTRSIVRHHAVAPAPAPSPATVHVQAVVVERVQRSSGERAVLDVRIEIDGRPVATLEHEAIVALPGT